MSLTKKENDKLRELIQKCDDLDLSIVNSTVTTLIYLRSKYKLEEL